MDFDLSEEQRILIHSARNFFEKEAREFARKVEKEEKQFSMEFWQKMTMLGWSGIVFPVEYGGTSGDFVDLLLLLEEMGKALIPGPFITAVVSGLTILHFGTDDQKMKFLPPIIEGKLIPTLALMKPGPTLPEKEIPIKAAERGLYEINGTRLFVPYAHVADWFLYQAQLEEGQTFFFVDSKSGGIGYTLLKTIAFDGQCQVSLDKVKVPQSNRIGEKGQGQVISTKIAEWGAVSQCAFILGLLEKVLELTVTHAKQREQFGKPIGSFQAIQHQCADMVTEIDKVKFLAYQAAWKLSHQMPAAKEISMAKARASDASRKVCLLGIKIHGGVGISEEHDLQLYFRRAKAAEIAFGDGDFHREIVAQKLGL